MSNSNSISPDSEQGSQSNKPQSSIAVQPGGKVIDCSASSGKERSASKVTTDKFMDIWATLGFVEVIIGCGNTLFSS